MTPFSHYCDDPRKLATETGSSSPYYMPYNLAIAQPGPPRRERQPILSF